MSLMAVIREPDPGSTVNARDVETELLRSMSPAKRLAVMHGLIRMAYELESAALRTFRPELSEEEIRALVRARVAGDRP